jgi:hypothetical protein
VEGGDSLSRLRRPCQISGCGTRGGPDGQRVFQYDFAPRTGREDDSLCGFSLVVWANGVADNQPDNTGIAGETIMDLAMAMGCALFGMFAGSTFIFFYKLAK